MKSTLIFIRATLEGSTRCSGVQDDGHNCNPCKRWSKDCKVKNSLAPVQLWKVTRDADELKTTGMSRLKVISRVVNLM